MMALAIALLSPLDRLSADLLSAHMIQHLILLIVDPVCLVLGRPLLVIRWGLPLAMRRRWVQRWRPNSTFNQSRQLVASPLLAFALYSAILWFWHLPAFYQAALQSEWVHVVEHSSFFAAATLLWWVVIFPHGGRDRYGISIAVIFLTAVQGSILGALLTFSTVLWYPMNSLAAASWGITPLDDQQLAGLIMWIPPGVLYLGAIVILFVNWLAAVEQGLRRRERAQIQRTRPLRLVSAHSQTDGG
jgi:cytochrome c oxidase assembly factor CtaG